MQLTLLLEPERIYPGAAGALALSIVTITIKIRRSKAKLCYTLQSEEKKSIYYLHIKLTGERPVY